MADRPATKSPARSILGQSDDGRMFASARVPDTNARLIVSIDEHAMLASIDRDIRAAYLQLGLVGLLVLIGAWFMSERLIIRPIQLLTNAATRFGAGDMTARTVQNGLPPEFTPLAQAFNGDGDTACRTRTRTDEPEQPALGAGLGRHAVRPCQPPRIRQPPELRMAEGRTRKRQARAGDDRHRSLQDLQRHLRPSRRRHLPDQGRRRAEQRSPAR